MALLSPTRSARELSLLAEQTVAKRFADDYGMDIRKADPKTVEAFVKVIAEESTDARP